MDVTLEKLVYRVPKVQRGGTDLPPISQAKGQKLLRLLNEEVPHGIAVTIEKMQEPQDKDILDISAVIYCERDSHKGIIIGKNGAMLKKIASSARYDLENFFEIQVNLQCFVKVKQDWRNKETLIRSFGLSE